MSLSNEKIYKHSWCVRVRWNPLEHNPSRPVETRRNPFRLTRLNPSKHVQTCWNTFPVNELFSIFIFLYFLFYTSSPLLLLLPHPPPPISPLHPHILFLFLFWGGEGGGEGEGNGAGDGDGTGGEPPPPPAGRSPLRRGGGTKSPPLLHQTKKNKIYKSNDICTLDNKNNIL